MKTRKEFILGSAGVLAAYSVCGEINSFGRTYKPMKTSRPRSVAVIWYSQTGNTERYGRFIARTMEARGLKVKASDYREFDRKTVARFDLVVIGSPVYYYDVPGNFQDWIKSIPAIDGTPVAGFVSFGGEGGNQHNTLCTLMDLVIDKGGVPAGMDMYGNMPTYTPTWSMGMEERILKYRHLPDTSTYGKIKAFSLSVLDNVRTGKVIDVRKVFDFREKIKGRTSIFWSGKLMVGTHEFDKARCIQCGTCTEKCPTGAMDYISQTVDSGRCVYCYGCINNCPAGAVNMTYFGKKMYGFREFLRRYNITIKEPV